MGGIGAAVGVAHAVCIAMVRQNKEAIARLKADLHKALGALVHGFTGLNCGFDNSSMANHVGVGKVEADKVCFALN